MGRGKFIWGMLITGLVAAVLASCNFDNPLTGGPTKNHNSWLLGSWEYRDGLGAMVRAVVSPLPDDRYTIVVEKFKESIFVGIPEIELPTDSSAPAAAPAANAPAPASPKPDLLDSAQFTAWISRVGSDDFLTLRCESGGKDLVVGKFSFLYFQVRNQNTVRVFRPALEASLSASSEKLRAEIRSQMKSKTLFDEEGIDWKRTGETDWESDTIPDADRPVRFPEKK